MAALTGTTRWKHVRAYSRQARAPRKIRRSWRTKLSGGTLFSNGTLTGDPLTDGDTIVVVGRHGVVQKLDHQTGKLIASVDLGQPLASGAARYGDAYLVSTADGTLLTFTFANVNDAKVTVIENREVAP